MTSPGGPEERRLREELVRRARQLYDRGLIAGVDGNLTARFGTRWLLATPSGLPKNEMEPDDLVLLDMGTGVRTAGQYPSEPRVARARRGRIPSSELSMHLTVYAERSDVRAVVHAHPPTAVGLTLSAEKVHLDICPEAVVFLGDVAFAPYATPGTDDLSDSLKPFIQRSNTLLLTRHGAVTAGDTLAIAHQRMESLEHIAKIYVAARQLGPVTPLPEAEQDRLRALAGSTKAEPDLEEIVRVVMERVQARL